MDYHEAMDYLEGLGFFGMKLGLERIEHLLQKLGNPEKKMKVVHVTGTNGKGSVSAMIGSIMRHAGYKVGVYTSPHLTDFRERITVNGSKIGGQHLANIMEEIIPVAEEMKNNKDRGGPTYFEIATAAALSHFEKEGVDLAVIEVGMGGRLDATNVVSPLVSVITNISFEHTQHLGNDIEKIASEKAAIIKPGCSVVTAASGAALNVIEKTCMDMNCELSVIGRNVTFHENESDLKGQLFEVSTGQRDYSLEMPLVGKCQLANAACAVSAAEALTKKGCRVDKKAIVKGIKNVKLKGRFEIAGKSPFLVLDGAHNPAGIRCVREAAQSLFSGRKIALVISICSDKDITGMLKEIVHAVDSVVVTRHDYSERVEEPEKIAAEASKHSKHVHVEPDVRKALERAKRLAGNVGVVLVTGSLYLVGDIKKLVIASSRRASARRGRRRACRTKRRAP
ncbi:MAG: bifunctional folylpolyglutamate synthase/dihydrofolate synthase [Candidatus Aenigmatarchaeota archaeon]|nr:MAG: bifunctional folylpolyglutamate synthase/dihydrofolate synthase [Candidatus Aenigmarchaeota archaeon]